MTHLLIVVSIVSVSLVRFHGEIWRSKIFVGLILLTFWIAATIWKRVHWAAALAFLSTVLSGIFTFAVPGGKYASFGKYAALSFDAETGLSCCYFLILIIPFLFIRRRHHEALVQGFSWVCILNAAVVLIQWFLGFGPDRRGGFFGNPSMNACMIAVTYPLLAFRPTFRPYDSDNMSTWLAHRNWLAWDITCAILPPLAIWVSNSSMGIGVLLTAILTMVVATQRSNRLISGLAVGGGLLLIAYLSMGAELFNDSDRLALWSIVLKWWWNNASIWFGTGQGSYFLLGPHIQTINNFRDGHWWIWLHSDFLQVLFEQGIIGFTAYLTLLFFVIRNCLKSKRFWLLSSVMAYVAMSLGNYPARMMVHGLLGVSLCIISLKGGTWRKENP